MRAPDVVERTDTPVEFAGNRFSDTFDGAVYRACVELRGASYGLEAGVIPGGRYARTRLRGEPPAVYELIGPAVAELERSVEVDRSRPVLEHYRRRDEIDALVPVV